MRDKERIMSALQIKKRLNFYINFPGLFFTQFSFFCSFMVVWGLTLVLGFWEWGFQWMGFVACGVGPSGF